MKWTELMKDLSRGAYLSSRNLIEFNTISATPEMRARIFAEMTAARGRAVRAELTAADEDRRRKKEREERSRKENGEAVDDLVLAVYRETQIRLLEQFQIDDEASRLAKERIDKRLAELARERQEMIERAVKLDDGRAVFLSEDGRSIYAEDGERLSDEDAAKLLEEHGDELAAGRSWETFTRNDRETDTLEADRAALLAWDKQREEWKAKVESGELTQEQLEELEQAYEAQVPDAAKELRGEATVRIVDAALTADEAQAAMSTETTLAKGFKKLADAEPAIEPAKLPERDAGVAAPAQTFQR